MIRTIDFNPFEFALVLKRKKLRPPEVNLSSGSTLQAVMSIVPCALAPGISINLAMSNLKKFLMEENPGLSDKSFGLKPAGCGYVFSSVTDIAKIVFVSEYGCNAGHPLISTDFSLIG
jgi:hypothetical protein